MVNNFYIGAEFFGSCHFLSFFIMSNDDLATLKEGDSPPSQVHLDALFGQFQENDPIIEFPRFHNVQIAKKGSGILSNIRKERIMARRKRLEQRLIQRDEFVFCCLEHANFFS